MTNLTAEQRRRKSRIRQEIIAEGFSPEDATFAAELAVGEHTGDIVLPDDWTEKQKQAFTFGTTESSLEAAVARDRGRQSGDRG